MQMKTRVWIAVFAVMMLALSACSSQTGGDSETPEENQDQTSSDQNATEGDTSQAKVEIFSWWTGAGEEAGLNALIDEFKNQYPNIAVENAAVAGGAGTNAKAVLASRMRGGDPPSTFQVHGGAELNEGWVAAGKMQTLNDFYEEQGWMDKFPEELIELVSKDGDIYSVPVNIHRGNVMWYNQKVFDEHGLSVPTTFEEFFQVADQLQAEGVTPLALGDKSAWTATHLYESVLLGTLGPEDYKNLWTGELSFTDDKVVQATETFQRMLQYVNEDHSARTWQDASQLVAEGDAAMNVMGDWAKGYFTNNLQLKPKEDFGWAPTPGTEGSFMVITDTFGLPKDIENEEAVKKFLGVLGSQEGQDVFNPLKGSIPARVDADASKYDVYGKETIEDFKGASLTPSLAHGSAAEQGFLTKVNQSMNIFVSQQDVQTFLDEVERAAAMLQR